MDPYTGLGHGLVQAGHEVTLVTHGIFEPLVEGSGISFHPLPVDTRVSAESSRGRKLHQSRTGMGSLIRLVAIARGQVAQMVDAIVAAADDSDVLLLSGNLAPLTLLIAEGLSRPCLGVNTYPLAPTNKFPTPLIGTRSWGPLFNRMAGHGYNLIWERVFIDAVREVRAKPGFPRITPGAARRAHERQGWPVFHGFSPRVVARPPDWPAGHEVVGYWWPYDRESELPSPLSEFLSAGPPPVFVGLGSLTVPDSERFSAEIVHALRASGLRGVIQRGWAELQGDGDDMITVGEVPHSLLFPRVAAVVHHAGPGTVAAGLRAGVPVVPIPIQFDQGFWAARLVTLGVAPEAIAPRELTALRLAAALRQATEDPSYARRAGDLAEHLRGEDGIAPVVDAVNRLAE